MKLLAAAICRRSARRSFVRCYDRGPYRKDYSDPGFQKLGYIDEGCYAYTQGIGYQQIDKGITSLERFNPPLVGSQDISKVTRDDYFYTRRKIGDARRRYEEERGGEGGVSSASKHSVLFPSFIQAKKEQEAVDAGPVEGGESSDLPSECKFRPIPAKKSNRKRSTEKKRGFKGMIQDYSNWTYPGSRLDEYTRKIAARKKKVPN